MADLEPIVQLLLQRGVLAEPLVRRAAQKSATQAAFLDALVEMGVHEPVLALVMAERLGMPGLDLSRTSLHTDVLENVPLEVASNDQVLPLSSEGGRLHVAVSAGLGEHEVLEELRFITGLEISPYAALPSSLRNAIAAAYAAKQAGERFWRGSAVAKEAEPGLAVMTPAGASKPLFGPRTEEILARSGGDDVAIEVDDGEGEEEVLHSEEVQVGPRRILAVDDDKDILRILEKALGSKGWKVDTALDGREAEKKIEAQRYDLVLLDAMLPHVHGFELCARLKASARTRRMPVLLLSAVYRGWRWASDVRETYGADDYIEKPFHVPDLLQRVETALAGAASKPPPSRSEADALVERGVKLLEAKGFVEATSLLERALQLDPHSARGHFALARALHERGELFRAITEYERAVELRPNLFSALKSLAALYEKKGFRRKAVEALERALHAAPDVATRDAIRAKLVHLL